ncbi:MAG TPA: YfiR family protein [Fimbriimonadaceae bacterium]|nr:YfiR family protein [Fimbriimonadaceae bacterium]
MTPNPSPNTRRREISVWLIGALSLLPCLGHAQMTEAKVKAAFLYNFAKYVEWPSSAFESPSSPIVIGTIGIDSLGEALEAVVEGKTAGGRRVVVHHFRWSDDISKCQELFVPASEIGSCNRLDGLRGKPVLVVGEYPGFAKRHGVINFTLEGNRIKFEINESNASHDGLTISSKLLSLGRRV